MKTKTTRLARIRRHERVRSKVEGTTERPRLSVFRSLNHIYAQVIDDVKKQTLVAASTVDSDIKGNLDGKVKLQAELVGQAQRKSSGKRDTTGGI
jgi:large subunit ribosomal protein L18